MIQFINSSELSLISKHADSFILENGLLERMDILDSLEGKKYTILPDRVKKEFDKAVKYVYDLTDKWSDCLSREYKQIMDADITVQGWKRFCTTYLYQLIFNLYWRYDKIKQLPIKDVFMVKTPFYDVFTDRGDYMSALVFSYPFSSDLDGYIFQALGGEIRIRTVPDIKPEGLIKRSLRLALTSPKDFVIRAKEYVKYKFKKKNTQSIALCDIENIGGEILLVKSRLPKSTEDKLSEKITCIDGVEFIIERNKTCIGKKIDIRRRNQLFGKLPCKSEFEVIARDIMPYIIPMSCIEYAEELGKRAIEICKNWSVRKIYHSAYSTELFELCISNMKDKGAVIYDIQHSGMYNTNYYVGFAEYNYQDFFLNWGWNPQELPFDNIIPVAVNRMPVEHEKEGGKLKNKKRFLMLGYTIVLSSIANGCDFSEYTHRQKNFIVNLPSAIRDNLVIRMKVDSDKSDLFMWCKSNYPRIRFEDIGSKPFAQSISESQLVICDHLSSAHLEALLLGKPIVVFEAMEIIKHNPVIIPYLKEMNKLGLYYQDGLDLAAELSKHEDYEVWLDRPEVKDFFQRYLRDTTGPEDRLEAWYHELIEKNGL